MALFTPKPLAKTCPLEDPAGDYKTARRAEQYRISGQAVYFPAFPGTQYLSFASLTRALTRNTSLPLTGCCGKALPRDPAAAVLRRRGVLSGLYL